MDVDPRTPTESNSDESSDSEDVDSTLVGHSDAGNLLDLPDDFLPPLHDSPNTEISDPDASLVDDIGLTIPDSLHLLQEELLGDYVLPSAPPSSPPVVQSLSESEELSLRHYIAWKQSNGTVDAYNRHAAVLGTATGISILSLYNVRKLATQITDLYPIQVSLNCIFLTHQMADNYL